MARKQSQRSRYWLGTQNDVEQVPTFDEIKMLYLVFQKEKVAHEHYQFYVQLQVASPLSALKKLFPGAHLEIQLGTNEQARDYCMKQESQVSPPIEFGEFKPSGGKQGARTDLHEILEKIITKKPRLEIINTVTYMKYSNGIDKIMSANQVSRDRSNPPNVRWYWGPSGTGKTRSVHDQYPEVWVAPADINGFWNGYENQEAILFDDFRSSRCKFNFLLQILDRYPMTVNVKGGFRQFTSPNIFITCNVSPEECYSFHEDKEEMRQLTRRITEVKEFNIDYITLNNILYPNNTILENTLNS